MIHREQEAQLRAQNNAPSWRDCNAAGLNHLWVKSHMVADKGYLAIYWSCRRASCSVDTRTTGNPWKPRGDLRR